jgi:tripartite-type tricarboxylate transporter receptor subunit TctC
MKRITALLFGLVSASLPAAALHAQTGYPSKPVRIVVPLGAGGASDVITRLVAQGLTERNGQPFVVENRPGANTIIGTDACAKAAPDGATLCMVTGSSLSINPFLYRKLPYDAAKDFEAITPLIVPDMIILSQPAVPANNMKEFLVYAKSNPGKLAYGSFGNGSDTHLTMEWFKRQTGTNILHAPFNGYGPMAQSFATGDIQLMYLSVGNPGIVSQVKSGKMRGLAVLAPTRTPQLPDVPTFAESGLGQIKGYTWFGLVAPAGTPRDVIAKVNKQVQEVLGTPAVREQLGTMAMRTANQSPDEFAAFLKQDREVWRELVKQTGVVLE